MPDRLRDLLDLVLGSLDEPDADGRALARRAHFSRDHLDRLLAAATGESPVALRRRLLLERAAWQLRSGGAAAEAGAAAGYGSAAAFSRAFARAYGTPPATFAGTDVPIALDAPNGVHFHPPSGLLVPGPDGSGAGHDLTERMVLQHLDRVRELLELAATLPPAELERPLRPGFVAVWFEGEEPSAALMAERLVFTLEVWVAAITGEAAPAPGAGPPLARLRRAGPAFARVARGIRDRGAWDDAFVDALCEPPQSFTYGGVLAHVLVYGAVRREALASVLAELGADVPSSGDPIEWEGGPVTAELELLDWKRRVFGLYAAVRGQPDAARGAAVWRAGRDELFATHPQTPLAPEDRASFTGLPYFAHDPAARVTATVRPAEPRRFELEASAGEPMAFTRFGVAAFRLGGGELELELYWLTAYGGGLFVPFADATSGSETYGAGRYLLDTVKGADLGTEDGRLVLDFNLAYNPSCSYDPRWACPLSPPANRLPVAVRAGERFAREQRED